MRAFLLLPTKSGLMPVRMDPASETLDQEVARLALLAEPSPDLISTQVRDLQAMQNALEQALAGTPAIASAIKSVA